MIFLGIFIFLVCLLAYYRKKDTAARKAATDAFWKRENEANHTRRQDISGLPYITIPLGKFPMDICDNAELKSCEQALCTLSEKKILNLGGQTNTDLKLKYGPSNLAELTEYDENFTTLCSTLVSYAECLRKLGYSAEARNVLEFGISCGCDHSQNYLLLADLYLEQQNTTAFHALIEKAESLDSPMKFSIQKRLAEKEPS